MEENKAKRIRRSPEQLAADLDTKIEALKGRLDVIEAERAAANEKFDIKTAEVNDRIKALMNKQKSLLAPKPPRKPRKTKKQKIQDLLKQAEKSGLKPEEIAERLGITME